jgi:beta-xylosidase
LVRSAIPDAAMAGPNISLESNERLFYEFLHHCNQFRCMPDYITVMLFPYQSVSDEEGYQYTQRISDFGLMEAQLQNVKRIMRECDAGQVKLSVSEWSSSLSNRNFLNDSSFRAAYAMKMIGMMWNKVDMACFWMGSDWISAYYDSGRVIQGGVGLISKDGIRKPVFYAVEFLNHLGKFFIECGENYIVTSNGVNSYYIACFNFKWYSCNYFIKGEHELDIKSLDTFFEDNDAVKIHFQLKNIQGKKKYTVKKHLLNDEYGHVLQEWIRFNCEEELEGSDVKYLREICIPHLSMQKIMATEDGLEFETELAAHEIALVHIYQDD